ncbi:MAG: multiheme c-type cytochrome [Ignavibacteriaceae bacterium]
MANQIPKTLIVGVVVTVAVLLMIYLFTQLPSGGEGGTIDSKTNTVVFDSADKCATCHRRVSPDIVNQFAISTMARAGVKCTDCHVVEKSNPMGKEHQGFFITNSPTPQQCAKCHPAETRQFDHSRHGATAWMALNGFADFSPEQQKFVDQNIPEANRGPNGIITAMRNSLFDIEGPSVTPVACQSCHSIGKPNLDGSIGNCNKCHLRHEFSLEQVRKPEICGQCHLGPDHPQMEIYEESAHGVMYATQGEKWNWKQKAGRLTTQDMPAPTCATCHISGFGNQTTTHDVGQRLSKFLFAAVTKDRPNNVEGREAMKAICSNCHSPNFISDFYSKADSVTLFVNGKVKEASDIIEGLVKDGIITKEPFATQISFDAFDLWHYYGRTAKFGAYMQGPDFVQWHGVYPLLKELNKVKEDAKKLREEHRKGIR